MNRRRFLASAGAIPLLSQAAPAATPPYRIPIELTDSRVLVECTIGEHGPYRFVFDTGGTIGLIELKLAQQLKLKRIGSSRLELKQGSGAYPIFVVPDLAFAGKVRQPVSTIAGVDVVNFRDGAVGSIAAGALTAADCELDFDAREWRIYPDGTPDRSGWTRYDRAIFHQGNLNGSAFIAADAVLGGRSFRLGLDTGMPSALHLYRKTAEAAGLWNALRWSPAAPHGKGRVVRTRIELAGEMIEGVIATLVETPEWSVFPSGVIGLPILRRFNMATAAKEGALFLRRNKLEAQTDHYNRAGLWIDRAGADVTIGVVGGGSPAEKAGLRAGDRLIGADFANLLEQMFAPAGTEIALIVERAGQRRDLRLRLEDFL